MVKLNLKIEWKIIQSENDHRSEDKLKVLVVAGQGDPAPVDGGCCGDG